MSSHPKKKLKSNDAKVVTCKDDDDTLDTREKPRKQKKYRRETADDLFPSHLSAREKKILNNASKDERASGIIELPEDIDFDDNEQKGMNEHQVKRDVKQSVTRQNVTKASTLNKKKNFTQWLLSLPRSEQSANVRALIDHIRTGNTDWPHKGLEFSEFHLYMRSEHASESFMSALSEAWKLFSGKTEDSGTVMLKRISDLRDVAQKYNNLDTKYPHLCQFIEDALVLNGNGSEFIKLIDKTAIHSAIVLQAEKVWKRLHRCVNVCIKYCNHN